MSDNIYNGWSNRETWLVNLHFEINSQSDFEYAKEQIQEWYDNLDSFMQDYVDLSLIDWDELESHIETEEEEE